MPQKPIKKVVIIGAGFAGLRAMSILSEHSYKFEITVIDKKDYSLLKPELPEVAVNEKELEKIRFHTPPALRKHNAAWEYGSVMQIDPDTQKVTLDTGITLPYDYLIIACGMEEDYQSVEGYALNAYSMCDEGEAIRLSKALTPFEYGDILIVTVPTQTTDSSTDNEPYAPCEGAAIETAFLIDDRFRSLGFRDDITITLVSPHSKLMPEVGENVRNKLVDNLEKRNIKYLLSRRLTHIEEGMYYLSDGSAVGADIGIVVPPFKTPDFIKKSHIKNNNGWLETDERMRLNDYQNIYAVGDVNTKSDPKLGHLAFKQAETVASTILNEENIVDTIIPYEPDILCVINMGANDAMLIYSDIKFGGTHDIAWESDLAKKLKIIYDEAAYYSLGELPPQIEKTLENILKKYVRS